jgi:hypothetical protein
VLFQFSPDVISSASPDAQQETADIGAYLLRSDDEFRTPAAVAESAPPRHDRDSRAIYYLSLSVIDVLVFASSFFLIDLLRHGFFTQQSVLLSALGVPVLIVMSVYHRAYSHDVLLRPSVGIKRSIISLAITFASTLGILFWLGASEDFSRLVFTAGALVAIAAISIARFLFGHALGNRRRWKFFNEVVLVDGMDIEAIAGETIVSARRLGLEPSLADPFAIERVSHLLKGYDRVVLACCPDRRAAWSRMLKALDIDVEVLVPELSGFRPLGLRQACGHSSLLVGCAPLSLGDRIVKRSFDLSVALIALTFLRL